MQKRFVSIYFRYLLTDRFTIRRPELRETPFILAETQRGRQIITAVNGKAETEGITAGLSLADARVLVNDLQVSDHIPGLENRLLKSIGHWCIRYSPIVALDLPDGLFLDASGCTHLWGGEKGYLKEILTKLKAAGYNARAAIADTPGTAWAIARFGKIAPIIESNRQAEALLPLPPAALRPEQSVSDRMHKLGLRSIGSFAHMPRSVLRRRFGEGLVKRLAQALGQEEEPLQPLHIPEPFEERLPCMEPIRTATGIEIAIQTLLEMTCQRLMKEGKGLRTAILTCYRIDGKVLKTEIGTNRPSAQSNHLFKLFALRIQEIEPDLGIELFTLSAPKVEEIDPVQEALWHTGPAEIDREVIELLDRIAVKLGKIKIHRYLPDEHHWPERSIKPAISLTEKPAIPWRTDKPRPVRLLRRPERIEVTAPIPDYPPMLFIHKGKRHPVKKADGPERIEREWWLDEGEHRDYYQVEDEDGGRYWLFRSGHYSDEGEHQWFLHGFFA